jgi:hypothetical protein
MSRVTKFVVIAIAVSMLTSVSTPCKAAENPFVETFQSSLYGGLVGALVGGAVLVFAKHPGDHLDYIAYGGAGGVLLGAGYGIAKASKSLAEYENGKVKFAIPTIVPGLQENTATGQTSIVYNAQLVRGTF